MEDNNTVSNTKPPFDLHAADYDHWFEEEDGKIIFQTEVKAFKEVLPLLPKPWLEIGVGSGRFASQLGISTGLDPSNNLLKIAKNRGIITIQGKAEDHNLPAESFGTIFLIMTLCFLDNPIGALKEIHRSLKRGGKIALGVVPGDSPWGVLYQQKKREGHDLYRFANFRTYTELQTLLQDNGFVIEKTVSTLFQKPGNVVVIENPINDFRQEAGFLVIVAGKMQ